MRFFVWTALAVALLLLSCSGAEEPPGDEVSGANKEPIVPVLDPSKLVPSDSIWAVVADPFEAKAYLLKQGEFEMDPNENNVGIRKVLYPGPILDDSQRQRIHAAALSCATEDWFRPKSCMTKPYLGLRFRRGERYVDFALCFECFTWEISSNHTPVAGIKIGFDDVAEDMVDLAQELFPDDGLLAAVERPRDRRRNRQMN